MCIHENMYANLWRYICSNKASFNIISSARENNLSSVSYLYHFCYFSD